MPIGVGEIRLRTNCTEGMLRLKTLYNSYVSEQSGHSFGIFLALNIFSVTYRAETRPRHPSICAAAAVHIENDALSTLQSAKEGRKPS